MSTICAASLFLSLVDLDVRDVERIHIKPFYLSIALSILEQIKNEISRLNRPTSLTIGLAVLRLRSSANTAAKAAEGNGLLVG